MFITRFEVNFMPNNHELSALARDAFVILNGAERIEYRDGDVWEPEDAGKEHPLVARLRAASLMSLTEDPPQEATDPDVEMDQLLRNERVANDNMRRFLVELEDVLHAGGMPKDIVGREVLTWLKGRLSGATGS